MPKKIYLTNSTAGCIEFHGKTMEEIAEAINMDKFEIVYNRNILSEFYGSILLKNATMEYYLNLSSRVTNSTYQTTTLSTFIGNYFEMATQKADQKIILNSGFVVTFPDEEILSYSPGEPYRCPEISYVAQEALVDKTISEVYNSNIISEIKQDKGKFIFKENSSNLNYIVINEMKVYTSKRISFLTDEQLKRYFDSLTFYRGEYASGDQWFRLGLQKNIKISASEPLFE